MTLFILQLGGYENDTYISWGKFQSIPVQFQNENDEMFLDVINGVLAKCIYNKIYLSILSISPFIYVEFNTQKVL